MPTAPSFDELEALARAEQILNRPDLQVFEGDVSEMLIKAAAAMGDRCIEFSAASFKELFLDGAEGDALTQLVNDRWALTRQEAVASTGQVTFTKSVAGPAGSIPTGTSVGTAPNADGQEFRFTTDTAVAWALNETGSKVVNVTAESTGAESNTSAGTVVQVNDTLFAVFTVTNAAAMVGGAPEETDEELRQRARDYPVTLRRGTLPALEFGAKEVDAVKIATAFEDTNGLVTVYVSDIDGNASAQMIAEAAIELENWRCAGVIVNVLAGVPLSQDVDYTLTVRPGTDAVALEPDIALAIEGVMNKLKQGETLFLTQLRTAIQNVDVDSITDVVINTPSANIAPLANELIRPGTITRS